MAGPSLLDPFAKAESRLKTPPLRGMQPGVGDTDTAGGLTLLEEAGWRNFTKTADGRLLAYNPVSQELGYFTLGPDGNYYLDTNQSSKPGGESSGGGGAASPIYSQIIQGKGGELYSFNPVTQAVSSLGTFPGLAADVNYSFVTDDKTGMTYAVNPTNPSERIAIGEFGFPALDPRETEERRRLEADRDFNAAQGSRRLQAQQFEAQEGRLRQQAQVDAMEKLGNLALQRESAIRDILRNPSDFVARAFMSRGEQSPLPFVSQDSLIQALTRELDGIAGAYQSIAGGQSGGRVDVNALFPDAQTPAQVPRTEGAQVASGSPGPMVETPSIGTPNATPSGTPHYYFDEGGRLQVEYIPDYQPMQAGGSLGGDIGYQPELGPTGSAPVTGLTTPALGSPTPATAVPAQRLMPEMYDDAPRGGNVNVGNVYSSRLPWAAGDTFTRPTESLRIPDQGIRRSPLEDAVNAVQWAGQPIDRPLGYLRDRIMGYEEGGTTDEKAFIVNERGPELILNPEGADIAVVDAETTRRLSANNLPGYANGTFDQYVPQVGVNAPNSYNQTLPYYQQGYDQLPDPAREGIRNTYMSNANSYATAAGQTLDEYYRAGSPGLSRHTGGGYGTDNAGMSGIDRARLRPPAVRDLMAGVAPNRLRPLTNNNPLPTPDLLARLTSDEIDAYRTALAGDNISLDDVLYAIERQYTAGVNNRRGRLRIT